MGAHREADLAEDLQHTAFAKRAQQYLTVREFATTAECVEALREQGKTIWVTAVDQCADVLAPGAEWIENNFPESVPNNLALVMGAEEAGVSQAFKNAADRLVYLPLCGFAESLNVSVAAALATQLILQILARAHPHDVLRLRDDEISLLRKEWYEKLANGEDELERFRALLSNPPSPFDDLRRNARDRVPWTKKLEG